MRQVAHVHQHVFVRFPGTPDEVDWLRSPSWSGAPRLPAAELQAFAQRVGAVAAGLEGRADQI